MPNWSENQQLQVSHQQVNRSSKLIKIFFSFSLSSDPMFAMSLSDIKWYKWEYSSFSMDVSFPGYTPFFLYLFFLKFSYIGQLNWETNKTNLDPYQAYLLDFLELTCVLFYLVWW